MKNSSKRGLIIFAKVPDVKNVKTRLRGHLSDEERVRLYTFLLERTIQQMKGLDKIDVFIAYTPRDGADFFKRYGLRIFPQKGNDIGERMFEAMNILFREGFKKVVLIGVDIPELSAEIVSNAFELLEDSDIVFGPANDGGYYLVGLRQPDDLLFREIPWSTSETLQRSIHQAMLRGYTISFTEELVDIDTIEDIRKTKIEF